MCPSCLSTQTCSHTVHTHTIRTQRHRFYPLCRRFNNQSMSFLFTGSVRLPNNCPPRHSTSHSTYSVIHLSLYHVWWSLYLCHHEFMAFQISSCLHCRARDSWCTHINTHLLSAIASYSTIPSMCAQCTWAEVSPHCSFGMSLLMNNFSFVFAKLDTAMSRVLHPLTLPCVLTLLSLSANKKRWFLIVSVLLTL